MTIIVDDAHWIDCLSLRVLAQLVQGRDRRLLIVLTSRHRDLDGFSTPGDELTCLPLQPLQPEVSCDIARRALRGTEGGSHAALHNWMADISNGLPLFIASLVAHYATTGEPFVVPPSLQDLIRKRLDQLTPGAALVLRTCVLLGSLASLHRIVACLEIPYAEILLAVTQLELAQTLKYVDGKLIPAHALVAESLLERTPKAVKELLHMRIAHTLEVELSATETPTVLWSCAEHWIAARDHERAFTLLRQCADHAREIGRPSAAADILLRCATMEVDSGARAKALREAVRLARGAHEHDLVLQAIARLRDIDPNARYEDIDIAELHALSVTHRHSLDYEDRVLGFLIDAKAQPEFRVRAGLAALQYADNNDRPQLADRVACTVSESDLRDVDHILALRYRLVYETSFGDSVKGAEIARHLLAAASIIPGPTGVGLQFNAMVALLRTGAIEEALAACEQVYERSKKCGAVKLQQLAALQMALLLVDKGRFAESIQWRSLTQSLLAENTHVLDGFDVYVHEIDFSLVEGNVAQAQAILRQCEALQIFNSPIRERWHRGLRARLKQLSGQGPLTEEELLELVREGNECIPTTGIRDLEIAAICTELCDRGKRSAAQEALSRFLSSRSRLRGLPIAPHLKHVVAACGLHVEPEEMVRQALA